MTGGPLWKNNSTRPNSARERNAQLADELRFGPVEDAVYMIVGGPPCQASALFSTSARRFIMPSVTDGPSKQGLVSTTRPYRKAPMTTALSSYTMSRDVSETYRK